MKEGLELVPEPVQLVLDGRLEVLETLEGELKICKYYYWQFRDFSY